MRSSPDPSVHQQREQQFVRHVESLLEDDRLRVDTTRGRRPISALVRGVQSSDHTVDLKRLMSEMNRPDRDLQSQMPVGKILDVALSERKWFIFKTPVGRLRVVCVSPTRALLAGEAPAPMTTAEVNKLLQEAPPAGGVPTTFVIVSTSGFKLEAHEAADRRTDRTVLLAEPTDAGGWMIAGPTQSKALADLLDPEAAAQKRTRIHEAVAADRAQMLSSGISADRLALQTQLPLQLVEAELKSYAKETPGLAAKRLDGKVVLFSQGSAPVASSSGGVDMPLIDRIKTLFARKGETEKKAAFLAERRTALSQQRDRGYEDMAALEKREVDLRQQFKDASSEISRRRITSQLLQLRKDLERRNQLLGVLNQQINIVSTHLHNLELVQQGQTAKLPDSEEMAKDAAAAEDVLAELQASSELADSVSTGGQSSLSAEEQALYEELQRESGQPSTTAATIPAAEASPSDAGRPAGVPSREKAANPPQAKPRRSEPEAG